MSPTDLKALSSVIDDKALLARCLNNLQFVERILALFDGKCGEELSELDRALEAGDIESVSRIAHRLTGACANAAAFELQSCASKLRTAAEKNALPEAATCLEELRCGWQRFSAALSTRQKTSV